MDEPVKPLRGMVGAHPGGRPAGVPMRLSSLDQPMEQFVGINGVVGMMGGDACVAPCGGTIYIMGDAITINEPTIFSYDSSYD